jgi:hypothetical protein
MEKHYNLDYLFQNQISEFDWIDSSLRANCDEGYYLDDFESVFEELSLLPSPSVIEVLKEYSMSFCTKKDIY